MKTPEPFDFGQLEAFMQDPLAFFKALSTFCHLEAEHQSEEIEGFTVEEVGPGKPWEDTARLIDLAIELWREEGFPEDERRAVMVGLLERISAMVRSYTRPSRSNRVRNLFTPVRSEADCILCAPCEWREDP